MTDAQVEMFFWSKCVSLITGYTCGEVVDDGNGIETVHSWRLNLDSWHPWTSHGTRPGGALQTSVLCNQIKRKQSNRLCKRHDNSNWKLWNLENKPEIFARTKVEIVGQKEERKLLLTQETLLFWIADTKLPLLKYSKAIAHPKHSWISQMVLFW